MYVDKMILFQYSHSWCFTLVVFFFFFFFFFDYYYFFLFNPNTGLAIAVFLEEASNWSTTSQQVCIILWCKGSSGDKESLYFKCLTSVPATHL